MRLLFWILCAFVRTMAHIHSRLKHLLIEATSLDDSYRVVDGKPVRNGQASSATSDDDVILNRVRRRRRGIDVSRGLTYAAGMSISPKWDPSRLRDCSCSLYGLDSSNVCRLERASVYGTLERRAKHSVESGPILATLLIEVKKQCLLYRFASHEKYNCKMKNAFLVLYLHDRLIWLKLPTLHRRVHVEIFVICIYDSVSFDD